MVSDLTHPSVLVVTAEAETVRVVTDVLAARDVRSLFVKDIASAIEQVEQGQWELIVADLAASGDALALLEKIKQSPGEVHVVLFGDDGPLAGAESSFPRGRTILLGKIIDRGSLGSVVRSLLPSRRTSAVALAKDDPFCLHQIIGESQNFLRVVRLAMKVAPTSVPVLITGETGTGKELISRLIHRKSSRSSRPFVQVNCAAMSDSLLESELFGHERGSFTSAHERRRGCFERAHEGTLLLDEISETTPRLQAELLRILEQQSFERVGGSEVVRVDVRVISTSNRSLADEVDRGRFRKDLYYRINGINLVLPPLREREEDIPALVWHFVNLYAGEASRWIVKLSEQMMEFFCQCEWPGNVRQLRNVIRAALILGKGPTLSLDNIAFLQSEFQPAERPQRLPTLQLRELERHAILEALGRTKRNQVKAARLLGITDRTLREKLRRYREADAPQIAGGGRQ